MQWFMDNTDMDLEEAKGAHKAMVRVVVGRADSEEQAAGMKAALAEDGAWPCMDGSMEGLIDDRHRGRVAGCGAAGAGKAAAVGGIGGR